MRIASGHRFQPIPAVPAGATALAVSTSQINVSWNASIDPAGRPVDYLIFIDGSTGPNAIVSALSYQHTGLLASSTHSYQVIARATPASGNVVLSGKSTLVSATTQSAGGVAPASALLVIPGTPSSAYVFVPMTAGAVGYKATFSNGATFTVGSYASPYPAGVTCRVDATGLPAIPLTCVVQAIFADGSLSGPSPTSNAATPAPITQTFQGLPAYYIGYGGGTVGIDKLWNNLFFDFADVRDVVPGQATVPSAFVAAGVAPAYPAGSTNEKMMQITPQGNSGYAVLLNIQGDNPLSSDGTFNHANWDFLCFALYRRNAAKPFFGGWEATLNYENKVTSVAGSVLTFANQTYGVNAFAPLTGNIGILDRRTGVIQGYVSNTATTLTMNSNVGPWVAGDQCDLVVGDQAVPNSNAGADMTQWITGPVPGVYTPNAWNFYQIPKSWMGLVGFNNNMSYKTGFGGPAPGAGQEIIYALQPCWVKAA